MAHNLRTTEKDGQVYVNASDLLKLMVDVMTMDSLHPEAIRAIDGLGSGLAITLGLANLSDLPKEVQSRLGGKINGRS